MADQIKIRPAEGTWSVRAGGAVLGETSDALELTEGDLPAVIYFPREDIAMEFLDDSDTRTTSSKKGEASYFSIVTKSTVLKDAAWSYETPEQDVAAIKDHLAFHSTDQVTVEKI
ncbi:MAG: DUF427 domain-containing protein [Silicimonas sp.]|jgi:uncharacterized protein (DUF427 family)|nr:DUF427 domain-containing protein [Silicimonas sp.]